MSRPTDSDVTVMLTCDQVALVGRIVADALPRMKPEAAAEVSRMAIMMLIAIQEGKDAIIKAYGSIDAAAAAAVHHLEANPWIEEPWL